MLIFHPEKIQYLLPYFSVLNKSEIFGAILSSLAMKNLMKIGRIQTTSDDGLIEEKLRTCRLNTLIRTRAKDSGTTEARVAETVVATFAGLIKTQILPLYIERLNSNLSTVQDLLVHKHILEFLVELLD